MADTAGYRGQHRFLFGVVVPVTSNASFVDDIGPVSDQVFVRGGVFCNGAADKSFLAVTVTTNVTLVGIILHDRINVLVVVTVPAAP